MVHSTRTIFLVLSVGLVSAEIANWQSPWPITSNNNSSNTIHSKSMPQILSRIDVEMHSEYSYQVYLRVTTRSNKVISCSGVIMDEFFILTTATCVAEAASINVIAGVHSLFDENRIERKPSYISIHEHFKRARYEGSYTITRENVPENDIALIKLDEPFDRDDARTSPLKITENEHINLLSDNCVVSGWGIETSTDTTAATTLQYLTITSACSSSLPIVGSEQKSVAVSACEGAGGGPIKCNYRLAGIMSSSDKKGCSTTCWYYTDVKYLETWIERTMEDMSSLSTPVTPGSTEIVSSIQSTNPTPSTTTVHQTAPSATTTVGATTTGASNVGTTRALADQLILQFTVTTLAIYVLYR